MTFFSDDGGGSGEQRIREDTQLHQKNPVPKTKEKYLNHCIYSILTFQLKKIVFLLTEIYFKIPDKPYLVTKS